MGRCTPLWFHPVNPRFVMCNDMIWYVTIQARRYSKYNAWAYSLSIGKTLILEDILRSKKLKIAIHVAGLLIYIKNTYVLAPVWQRYWLEWWSFTGVRLSYFSSTLHLHTHSVVSPCWIEGSGRGGYTPETGWLPVPVGARKASGWESSWETADPGALQDQGWGYLVFDEDWVFSGDHKPTGNGIPTMNTTMTVQCAGIQTSIVLYEYWYLCL